MEILHRRQRATVEEIRDELPDASSPSSVRKLLDIMIDRGLLGREYDGPRFVYFPAVKPEEASRSALKGLVRTFFNDSPGSAMAALLDMKAAPLSESLSAPVAPLAPPTSPATSLLTTLSKTSRSLVKSCSRLRSVV
jgi:predicted transcriptional regulator